MARDRPCRLWQATALAMVLAGAARPAPARVDLVTLPTRDAVQITIYNSADMTLVRDQRLLTLRKGLNELQFSWANTLIDPTSLELLPKAAAGAVEIAALDFPARVTQAAIWQVRSKVSGETPMEITYLTSGLSWRAFYLGTLTPDEATMRLEGYVRVLNRSGEDYENAQTRLIVGKVHLLDEIALLARRPYPYGSPVPLPRKEGAEEMEDFNGRKQPRLDKVRRFAEASQVGGAESREKQIVKEGLSEYFLYTIEGTETIPDGWSKRLPSFTAERVPIVNLYKHEEERYGKAVVRFLSFKNDKAHTLGQTPIPGGVLKVCRAADKDGRLAYEGQSSFKYIPVDEDVELSLGPVANVLVEPKLMDFKTGRYLFDSSGDVAGWDEIREFKVEVKNTRALPVKIEIRRNFPTQYWSLTKRGDFGDYEKVDLDTVKFTLRMPAAAKQEFRYVLTTRHGLRQTAKGGT